LSQKPGFAGLFLLFDIEAPEASKHRKHRSAGHIEASEASLQVLHRHRALHIV